MDVNVNRHVPTNTPHCGRTELFITDIVIDMEVKPLV